MKLLFENWRGYLTESQLLVEGRIQDAERKFPELAKKREELDGESLLGVLIQGDPSENQKYLMGAAKILKNTIDGHVKRGKDPFWGKQWPEDEEIDDLLIKGMKRGTTMIVKGISSRGTNTTDTYSLRGFTASYKAISKICK